MFTALAASNATTANEMIACIIIRIFAQRERACVSAGDNAVLVLKAKNKESTKLGDQLGSELVSKVERQNWTVRTTMRRYTRLSNGFSRKLENHAAATALNYFAYNFIKIHRTLRMSPAMAAGVTDRLWEVNDLVALWEAYEQRRAERAA